MSRRGGSAHLNLHTGNVVRSSLIRNSLSPDKRHVAAPSVLDARLSVSAEPGSSDAFPSRAA
jgi:hypothetical protein